MADLATTGGAATRDESREWLRALGAKGARGQAADARLYALLVDAALFEVARRHADLPRLRPGLGELALQAAEQARLQVHAHLGEYRDGRHFTTWACKFAVREAATMVRLRAWQGRELPAYPTSAGLLTRCAEGVGAGERRTLALVVTAVGDALTDEQRRVLVAVAVDGVPIDVLAERQNTTRASVYATLHEARRALRERLADARASSRSPQKERH